MAIEQFTKSQFEQALPKVAWTHVFTQGEWVYYIPVFRQTSKDNVPTNKRIVVRSSVGRDGYAAGTGSDSIRHWVEYQSKGRWWPLTKDTKNYTTRVAGWEERLIAALRRLWQVALDDCKGLQNENHPVSELATRAVAHTNSPQPTPASPGVRVVEKSATTPSDTGDRAAEQQSLPGLPASAGNPFDFLGGASDLAIVATNDESVSTVVPPATTADSPAVRTRTPNAEQLAAIEADIHRPLRILAPPGSGKTFLLSHRYAFLLSQGVNPQTIVAVTFNRTMADELLTRIANANPSIEQLKTNDPTNPAVVQITTIHALCYRILRAEGDKRSVPDKDGRVKPWQIKKALEEIIGGLWPIIEHRPGYQEVQAYIDAVKAQGLSSEQDRELYAEVRDKWGDRVGDQLHFARQRFDRWCRENGVLQFADMLYDVDRRLQDDVAFRARWQARYQYLLIDEGQDTSAQAMRILTTLAAPQDQVTIVGDTDQLLYRFTGATPEANLYEGFEQRYPTGQLMLLEVNYRSTAEIIQRYSRMIQRNYHFTCPVCQGNQTDTLCPNCAGRGHFDGPYAEKYFKHIHGRPDVPEGEPISFVMYDDALSEAQAVVQQIQQLLAEGREPDDFFIGARTCAQTGYLEGPLVQAGIPYINLTGSSFWKLKHVRDIVAYLQLALDENDSEAFVQVYNIASAANVYSWGQEKGQYCHHRFLGQEFLKACEDGQTCQPQYRWRWSAVKRRSAWRTGVQDLEEFLLGIQQVLQTDGLSAALNFIIEQCYESYLRASEGIIGSDAAENGKLDDLQTVQEIAGQFEADPASFLFYVQQARQAAEQAQKSDWAGHVVISTIHRLKGLERPVVFGIGLCEGIDKNGAPVGLLPHTYSMRPPAIQGVLPMGGQGRIEDERDVCYVLVSRAAEAVYLSGCAKYRNWTLQPSRFIYEMGLL